VSHNAAAERDRQLSESEIVEAALRLIRRHGMNRLTMRELADELDVTAMAPYYYVKSKQRLLELVADAVLARVEIPTTGTWEDRLREVLSAQRRELAAHPGVAGFLVRLGDTPNARRLEDAWFDMLLDAGFDERRAALAHAAIQSYMFGRSAIESVLRDLGSVRAIGRPSRAQQIGDDPPDGSPRVRADEFFAYGLDLLLAGLRLQLDELEAHEAGERAQWAPAPM
jgi:AcrR family transcriptional regulator